MDGLCSGCFNSHFPQPNRKLCKLQQETKRISRKKGVDNTRPPRLRGGADNYEGDKRIPLMVDIAIENAAKHGISLHQGVPNLANGNCMFESIVDNISTRACFVEVLNGTPDYYRKVWLDEAEDLVLRFSGGYGRSEEQFRKDWAILKNSRIYEYELADFVLPAIAHCIRKDILIFNAKISGNQDPIYVVQASTLGGRQANTKIPILLAYNEVHYEGLVLDSSEDLAKTVALKEAYLNGKYSLTKADIPIFSSIIEDNVGKASDDNLSYAQVLKATTSSSMIKKDLQKGFESCKRRSSTRVAEQSKSVALSVDKKQKTLHTKEPEKNTQPKKARKEDKNIQEKLTTKETQKINEKIKKTTKDNKEIMIEKAKNIQGHDKEKNITYNEELVKRFEELKAMKASSRTLVQRNEMQRLRTALKRASETVEERDIRLEKKKENERASRASETVEERDIRLEKMKENERASRASETEQD
jgi:hypothetical protein